ncbi:MAG: hypothetical protein EA411_02095 [Saprospirales bacterium]|nr:MAG: hypothetical protein EA411_02095 [Saprospirales bacterium]
MWSLLNKKTIIIKLPEYFTPTIGTTFTIYLHMINPSTQAQQISSTANLKIASSMKKILSLFSRNPLLVFSLVLFLSFGFGNGVVGQAFFDNSSPEDSETGHFGYWNFNSFDPNTDSQIPADFNGSLKDSLKIDLSGFSGTINNFAGNANNALGGDAAGASLSLVDEDGNGTYIEIKISMKNLRDLEISYWSSRTGTGFDANQWAYSLDGMNFTDFGPVIDPNSTSSGALETIDASGISAINGEEEVFLRYTVDGATSGSGNNRIDNLRLTATYEASGAADYETIPYSNEFSQNPYTQGWIHRNVEGPDERWTYNSALELVRMNAFSGGCQINDDWFISPPFDMNSQSDEILNFETDENFSGTDLVILYSTDYDGIGDPTDFTWTELATIETGNSGVFSDPSILSGISGGSVYFAFRYQFQSGGCSQWDILSFGIDLPITFPLLDPDPDELTNLDYFDNAGPSNPQSFDLSGSNLDGNDVTIEVPADFEISFDEMTAYSNELTLDSFDGSDTSVYVRLTEGLALGSYSGTLIAFGGGADTVEVVLNGEVTVDYDYFEPFDNFPVTAGSYQDGNFIGVMGNQWDYVNARGDIHIDPPTVTLQNNSTAQLISTLNSGISDFSFDYMQAFGNDVNLEVYINDDLVATVTSDDEQNVVKNSGNISVNYPGTFTIEFKQGSGGGQVAIDNFSWKGIQMDTLTAQTTTINDVTCHGGTDGSIEIEVEGGMQPYTFSWEGPGGFTSSDSNLTDLAPGPYDLTVTDAEDSTATLNVIITEPDQLEATWTTDSVSCFGGSDGSIEFQSPTGGSGNYEFSIDGGDSWQQALLFDSLEADTFDLRIRDADFPTCAVVLNSAEVISQPEDFTSVFGYELGGAFVEFSDGDTICAGIEATRVYLLSTEGNAPLEILYSVNDGSNVDTSTYTGVMPGDEAAFISSFSPGPLEVTFLSITDDNGCESQAQKGFSFVIGGGFGSAAMSSNPDSVSVENGSQFEVIFSVDISGCDAVQAIFLEMEFDSDFVEVVDIEAIDWNTGETQTTSDSINNTDGFFSFEAEQFQSPNPADTTFEFVKVTFEAKQTTGDSVTMLEYIPPGFVEGTEVLGFDFLFLGPLEDIPIQIFGCDEFDINMGSEPTCFGASDGQAEVESVSGGTAPYSYLWDTGDTTQTIDSVAAGLYAVTVTDDEGCTGTAEVTVTERDSIEISTTVVDAECFGEDGSITMGATGGNGGFFDFTVNDENVGGSSGTLTVNRPAGTYEIIATNSSSGCQGTTAAVLNQPDSIQFNEQITDPLCPQETGTIEFNPSGGTGNISMTLADTAVSSPLELPDGSYTLVATDDAGCVDSIDFTITEPDEFSIVTVLQQPDCPGELWDFLFLVSGGTGQLTFTLNGDTIDAPLQDGDFVGDSLKLPADDYILLAIDENECTLLVNQFSMVDAPPIPFPVEVFDAPCFGDNGLIVNEIEPGNVVFFVDGDSIGSELMFVAEAGQYLVTVEDEDGCTRDSLMTIGEPDEIDLQLTVTQPTCETLDGMVTFDPIGGTGIIEVTIDEEEVNSPLNLPPGSYELVYSDDNECIDTATVVIIEPELVELSVDSVIDATCFGENGTIGFSATGGNQPMTFTLDGAEVTSPVEPPAGTYTLIASDGICGDTANVTISEPDEVVVEVLSVEEPDCFGEEGTILFTASGGNTSFYEFTVNDENAGSSSGTVNFNVEAGQITIEAEEFQGCSGDTTFVMNQSDSLELNLSVTNPDCEGEIGQVTFDPQGGTGDLTVLLIDTAVTSPLELPEGSYAFTVIDQNGCENSDSIEIDVLDPFSLTGEATDAQCHGENGLLTFSVQGGQGDITFLLDNEEVQSPLDVPAGSYTIVGEATGSGCTDSITLVVNQPDPIALSVEVTDANCFGEDGSLSISASGGTGSFIFTVNEEFVGSSSVTVNRPAGEYLVSASHSQVCVEDTLVTIGQPDSLVLSAVVTDAPCFGEDGTLELSATGGTAPYYFFIGESSVDSLVMLPPGDYSIQLEDENGCSDSGEVDIGEPDPVEATFSVNGESIEDGDTLSFTSIDSVLFSLDSILSGFAPLEVEYSIFDGTSTNDFAASSLEEGDEIFKQTFDAGFYDITITSIEDDNDCSTQTAPYLTFALDVEEAVFPLSGNVTIFSACADREVEVLFYDAGTTDLLSTQSGVLDSVGNFSIDGVIAGQYDVFVDVGGYLLKGLAEVIVNQNNLQVLDFGSLTAGDVNGDNNVGQADLDALLEAYNTLETDADYNANADFDCNGKVNIDDLTKLIENKGKTGDQPGDL